MDTLTRSTHAKPLAAGAAPAPGPAGRGPLPRRPPRPACARPSQHTDKAVAAPLAASGATRSARQASLACHAAQRHSGPGGGGGSNLTSSPSPTRNSSSSSSSSSAGSNPATDDCGGGGSGGGSFPGGGGGGQGPGGPRGAPGPGDAPRPAALLLAALPTLLLSQLAELAIPPPAAAATAATAADPSAGGSVPVTNHPPASSSTAPARQFAPSPASISSSAPTFPPAAAAAAAAQAAFPSAQPSAGSNATPLSHTATTSPPSPTAPTGAASPSLPSSEPGPGPDTDVSRLKRLLREAFAELYDARARLDELEAAAAAAGAAEQPLLPLHGATVRPYMRGLGAGLRPRSAAQVSGSLEAAAVVALAAAAHHHDEAGYVDADGGSSDGGLAAAAPHPPLASLLREAGVATAPRLRLLLQSMWELGPGGKGAVGGGPPGAGALGNGDAGAGGPGVGASGVLGAGQGRVEPGPVATGHALLSSGPDGSGLRLDKLLAKVEAHPRLKVLLSARGGALDCVARHPNPFAAASSHPGLTDAGRRGHGLAAATAPALHTPAAAAGTGSGGWGPGGEGGGEGEGPADGVGGLGAAVCGSAGSLSAAYGQFVSGPLHDPHRRHSALQLSLHRSRTTALSALWAATTAAAPAAAAASAPSASSPPSASAAASPQAARRGPQAGAVPGQGQGGAEGEEARWSQFGLIGATQLSDRLTAAAWWGWGWGAQHAAAGSAQAAAEATGAAPPGDALTAAPLPASTRRGFRLATLPDPDSGRSYMLSCSSTAWGGASGAEGRQGGCGGMLAVEASAALPVAHGVVLTPGLVVLRRTVGCGSSDGVGGVRAGGGVTVLCAALGTQWSF